MRCIASFSIVPPQTDYFPPEMDSDDEFSDQGSVAEADRDVGTPKTDGMATRTRSKNSSANPRSAQQAYAWEDELQRTWDIVGDGSERQGGSIESLVQQMVEMRKKKIMRHAAAPFQRGIIRTLVVVLDASRAMLEKDLRPTRFGATLNYLQEFVVEFFDQNPVAQLAIVQMRNGVASVLSEVSGSPQHHLDMIRAVRARQHNKCEPQGDPSLQNALELARVLLEPHSAAPRHSREILVIFGALFSSDPGDIHKTISALARDDVKVKVIGLSAQVAVCQELVAKTNLESHANGSSNSNIRTDARLSQFYGVITNETHFKELLMACVEPLAVTKQSHEADLEHSQGVPLLRMGFPSRYSASVATFAGVGLDANFPHLCACHPTLGSTASKDTVTVQGNVGSGANSLDSSSTASALGYICPQCSSRVCSLPTVCPVCGLMLILSTHLARSYHHLVPLLDFKEVPVASTYKSTHCYGCLLEFPEGESAEASVNANTISSRYRCGKCHNDFCIDCDVFVHESLHNCPGCENTLH